MTFRPYSAEVVRFAREIGAYSVRGNHDDLALSYALPLLAEATSTRGKGKDSEKDKPTSFASTKSRVPSKLDFVNQLSRFVNLCFVLVC